MFHHVGRKVPRQCAKKIQQVFLPRDEFTSSHRHFAEHVIDCDARELGTACGKVFVGRAGEKRLRSRALRVAETHSVERALQERVKGRGEVKVESSNAGQIAKGATRHGAPLAQDAGKPGVDSVAFAASQKMLAGDVVK